jgi:hypothetical protein
MQCVVSLSSLRVYSKNEDADDDGDQMNMALRMSIICNGTGKRREYSSTMLCWQGKLILILSDAEQSCFSLPEARFHLFC